MRLSGAQGIGRDSGRVENVPGHLLMRAPVEKMLPWIFPQRPLLVLGKPGAHTGAAVTCCGPSAVTLHL